MSTSLPCMCIAWLCDFSCLSSTCRSLALCAHSNLLYACAILHHDILLSPAQSWVYILTELPSNIHAPTCMVKPHVIVFGRDHDTQQISAAYVKTKFREAPKAPTHCWQNRGFVGDAVPHSSAGYELLEFSLKLSFIAGLLALPSFRTLSSLLQVWMSPKVDSNPEDPSWKQLLQSHLNPARPPAPSEGAFGGAFNLRPWQRTSITTAVNLPAGIAPYHNCLKLSAGDIPPLSCL